MTTGLAFRFDGKVALVTGASGGIGAAVASKLARAGARVLLCGTREDKLAPLLDTLRGDGAEVYATALDITHPGAPQSLANHAEKLFGRIDVLVNSAGINRPQKAEDVTEGDWDAVYAINVRALFLVSRAAGRVMIRQGGGRIVNISSQTGTVALPLRAAYCSSKAAVDALTRSLAFEWAPHNITVNAVAPTFVNTPFVTNMFKDEAFKRFVLESIPRGRMATAEEVADATLFLASDQADMITGQVLLVDGGWTIK